MHSSCTRSAKIYWLGLLRLVPGRFEALSEASRLGLVAMFPTGELLCGLGLLWNRTRAVALVAAVCMHLTLIGILGPWNLNHSWGVLLWNVVFIGLDILMWRELTRNEYKAEPFRWVWSDKSDSRPTSKWQLGVGLLCVAMVVLPLGERVGLVDHWLGWALYAPHSSRARIEVLSNSRDAQPESVRRYLLSSDQSMEVWHSLAAERWSLETLGVPIVPQQRFYVAVAIAVAQPVDEFDVRVNLLGTANRWSGRRSTKMLEGRRALMQAKENYFFNTQPRWY